MTQLDKLTIEDFEKAIPMMRDSAIKDVAQQLLDTMRENERLKRKLEVAINMTVMPFANSSKT